MYPILILGICECLCIPLCSHFDHKLDLTTSLSGMAPKKKLTAALFQELYGDLVSEHFAQHTTAYTLRIALSQRKPPIIVTDGILKLWFAKYRLPSDAVTVSSAEELHTRYGDVLPALAAQNPSGYRLRKAQSSVFEIDTKMVLLFKILFLKVIPKLYYSKKQ